MSTINEIKIESLKEELHKEMQSLEKYKYDIEILVKELVRYETNNKMRNEELTVYAGKLENLKNSIPDFDEETYALYVKYDEMKNEYEIMVKNYGDINKRTEKMKEDIASKKDSIAYKQKRIQIIENEIKEAESEN